MKMRNPDTGEIWDSETGAITPAKGGGKMRNPDTGEIWDPETGAITPAAAAEAPADPEGGFSVLETFKNMPGSAVQLGKDMMYPIAHPVDAATGMASLIRGGMSKIAGWDDPDEDTVTAVADFYADRYGSMDKAMETLQADPVGFLSDASMVFGGAAKMAAKAAKIGNVAKLGPASEKLMAAGRVATGLDPVNVMANTVGAGVKAVGGKVINPAEMYQQAAKITRTNRRPQRKIDQQIQTALDEQIMPTAAGVEKATDKISRIDGLITDVIKTSTDSGGKVSKNRLFVKLKKLRRKLGGSENMEAAGDLRVIDRVVGDFNQHLEKLGKDSFSAEDLQALKQNTYRQIDFDRSQMKSVPAADEARKAVARAAKEGIEDLTPGDWVRDLNAREGRLLELKETLEPVASRIERRNTVGIELPITAMSGQAMGGGPGAAVGAALGFWDRPKIKAGAALKAHKLQGTPYADIMTSNRGIKGFRAGARQGLMEAGQLMTDEDIQSSLWDDK